MKRYLTLFWLFSIYSIKTTFQQRFGVILFLLGKIIRFLVFFVFVYQLLSRTKFLAGYTLDQTIIFYLTYTCIDNLGQLLFREVYRFRPLVVSGDLSGILIKPYHPFIRILLGGVDALDMIMMIPYTAILVYYIIKSGPYSLEGFITYLVMIAVSMVIVSGFHILILTLGLLTTEVDHASLIYRDITRMGSVPVDIYKEPVRSLLTFAVPVALMMTVPVKGLFGRLTPLSVAGAAGFCIIFIAACLASWRFALRRYQGWGG